MCKTLTIDKKNAVKAYNGTDDNGKKLLTDLLGEKAVTPDIITDVVKTLEDACEVLGLDPAKVLPFTHGDVMADDIVSMQAYAKLIIIARALNEGWVPDYNNGSEYKWYPYFTGVSGSGLSFYVTAFGYSDAGVVPRLVYKTRQLAEYAAKQFTDIYTQYFSLTK